ncbi:chloride channel protein [Bacillus sp. OTU530]|uniref:chloride channel protein n=1 Tax=Bacillus sp. OTU530 TaxID=3043862 RepID=UPI00313ECFAF
MKHARTLSDFILTKRIFYLSTLALIVGVIGALIAVILMKMINFFTNLFFYQRFSLAFVLDYPNSLGAWVIVVPIIGGIIIGLMARFGSEKIRGHGIPEAMEAILLGKSIIAPKVAILKPISAAISIGSGGPFGAEGPIIMTGGSIGSIIGQLLHITAAERKVLLLSGAAAGMCATFNAPIASVLFVVELLAFEMRPRSVVPIALASGAAAFVHFYLLGNKTMFPSKAIPSTTIEALLIPVMFGIISAVLAYILTKCIYGTEDLFRKLPLHWMWWPAFGAIAIGIGGFFVPQVLGVGYDSIHSLVQGQFDYSLAIKMLIVKTIIWIIALGSGTSGGILAPLLIIGGSLGNVLAVLFHAQNVAFWAFLGMAATFCGVTRSPFTTVIFLLELTHDIDMLLPTLITCAISAGISALILPRSILTEKIARRNIHISRDYMVDPLELCQVSEIMSKSLLTVPKDSTIAEVIENILQQNHVYKYETYPIVTMDKNLVGMLTRSELLPWITNPRVSEIEVGDQFSKNVITISQNNTGKDTVEQMIYHGVDHVVVLDKTFKPVGIVTYGDLLKAKRKYLEEENMQEKHIRLFNKDNVNKEYLKNPVKADI